MTNTIRSTSSAADPKQLYQATTTPQSERLLAHSMGYPLGWHVVRVVPHPAAAALAKFNPSYISSDTVSFQDRIYAGDPRNNVDTYYNHSAAFAAALQWKEKNTGYERGGGQMLPLVASYPKGETVEVYYEPDDEWYEAVVVKVKQYDDDIRYTVHYTDEDATQTNVCEDQIRKYDPAVKKTPKSSSVAAKNKKSKILESPKANKRPYKHAPEALELASKMGLPPGWSVRVRSNSRYTFRSPDGLEKFTSKKVLFEHLGLGPPPPPIPMPVKQSIAVSPDNNKVHSVENTAVGEEGDPPWRRSGHKYLNKKVKYCTRRGGEDDNDNEIIQWGTVQGWISNTDVDKQGDPGFISEVTSKPAALFHVVFGEHEKSLLQYRMEDREFLLESLDMEEFELLECIVKENSADEDEEMTESEADSMDEDDVPLTALLHKNKDCSKSEKRQKIA